MAQWAKTLAAKPNDLSSIPRTQRWKEKTHSHKLTSDVRMHTNRHMPPHKVLMNIDEENH